MAELKTAIATSTEKTITIRGHDLVDDIIGRRSVTDLLYLLVVGRWPQREDTVVLDACLVALAEHGLTPSAIVARLVAESVPEEKQVAIAAGALTVGSVFVGTMDGCARILHAGVAAPDPVAYCRAVIADHRGRKKPLPGFGHPFHRPDDPRAMRLFDVAREVGRFGDHARLLHILSAEFDRMLGRHLTINVTGAIGALLLEIGIPIDAIRGIAVVSRCVGLCGHVAEEAATHSAGGISELVASNFSYEA
jgi:citrate synthase